MTGCPNGCARHALGEIGFIGKAPGKYNMYLGAAFDGSRLSKMYRENVGEEEILNELGVILPRYAKERRKASTLVTLSSAQELSKQLLTVRISMIDKNK